MPEGANNISIETLGDAFEAMAVALEAQGGSAAQQASHAFARVGVALGAMAATGDPTFAVPASLLGVPALSLPLLSAGGLPLGLQVIGFEGRDADLFAVAAGLPAIG
jgi:Asp-tRNA(Asn)/Glu-tRNA(Gln) amidotransferase A subunit family amidase